MEKPLKVLCYTLSAVILLFTVLFVFGLFAAFRAHNQIQRNMELEQARYDSLRAVENS